MKKMTRNVWAAVGAVAVCLLVLAPGRAQAASNAKKILAAFGRESGVFVVIGCGEDDTAALAVDLGKNGNSLVHVLAADAKEVARVNRAVARAGVKGCVTAECLPLAELPYRDYIVNVLVVMDQPKAEKAGLRAEEVRRCLAPCGRLVTCEAGAIQKIEEIPLPKGMDTWTHRYHGADGLPVSTDKVFDLPLGFRWNAGLPMNFDNPQRSANRYSSTRALLLNDGRCFTFSTAVYENLGATWKSPYGTDQYLTCRDAFNGRMLWRKKIGDTYYGGLYIENLAPMISIGRHIYLAGANGKMHVIDTRTGKTLRELPTTYIPGVIAASGSTVVAATWKGGKVMGSIRRYDRRRMDWAIAEGTIEAYDDQTGKLLWKTDLLGTSLLISDGRVFLVNRVAGDPLEEAHNRRSKPPKAKAPKNLKGSKGSQAPTSPQNVKRHPPQKVIALDLAGGNILWEAADESFQVHDQALSLEAAAEGAVAVGYAGRRKVALLSAKTGKPLEPDKAKALGKTFFRFRNHICTPVLRTEDIQLTNRGGTIIKGGQRQLFGGARAGCLIGTVPAYGAGYIPQNWCRCSPAQISGLLALAPIGKIPTPAEMEVPTRPVVVAKYDEATDGVASPSMWTSFRGNAARSSSAPCKVRAKISVAWTRKVAGKEIEGTVQRDWRSLLNTRLTAPVTAGHTVIVGDIDHNELIALDADSGKVQWRLPLAGRMDTAPTLHKGLCLAGDHAGYVYAVKIKTGELLYRLRIAPFEKRMLSYGKVESVWPVVGGVMVAGGKAYASAGRTQGSDGGLLVRAFVPETGQVLWSKALPQEGNNRQLRRNDTLALHKDTAMVMGHRLKLASGEPVKAADKAPTVTIGLEGLYSWNWTRLGHRKFQFIGFGDTKGDTVAWSDRHVALCDPRNGLSLAELGAGKPKRLWAVNLPKDRQVTSLILCENAVLIGGVLTGEDQVRGFVQALGTEKGQPIWDKTFPSKLAFNGLAVDNGRILAAFDDGSVACLE